MIEPRSVWLILKNGVPIGGVWGMRAEDALELHPEGDEAIFTNWRRAPDELLLAFSNPDEVITYADGIIGCDGCEWDVKAKGDENPMEGAERLAPKGNVTNLAKHEAMMARLNPPPPPTVHERLKEIEDRLDIAGF